MKTPYSHLHPALDTLTPRTTDADVRALFRPLLLKVHADGQTPDPERFRALLDARDAFMGGARARTMLALKKEGWRECTVCGGLGHRVRNGLAKKSAGLVVKKYACTACDSSGWEKT